MSLNLATVRGYLQVPATLLPDEDLARMLAAATADQNARCTVPPDPDGVAAAQGQRLDGVAEGVGALGVGVHDVDDDEGLGVVGDAPSDDEVGVVGQLPYPSASGVADRFTGTEPAEFVEPFTQAPASVATGLEPRLCRCRPSRTAS